MEGWGVHWKRVRGVERGLCGEGAEMIKERRYGPGRFLCGEEKRGWKERVGEEQIGKEVWL